MEDRNRKDGIEPSSESDERPLERSDTETNGLTESDKESFSRSYREQPDSILLRPPRARILILADGDISFGNQGFGLSILVDTLVGTDHVYVHFDVTTATRNIYDNTADIAGFSFERDFNPDRYDEVWLFGMDSNLKNKLPSKEVEILARFMNDGNGVFATGDHMALGAPLCGEVPRVRHMRKWFFDDPLPCGQPRAIPRDNEFRHDTLRKGHDCEYDYGDQSDDVPQVIFPEMDIVPGPPGCDCCPAAYPHIILDSPSGVIRFLPDHIHEGECYVPTKLDDTFEIGGCKLQEFPFKQGNTEKRVAPKVIAYSQIPDPHNTVSVEFCWPALRSSSFGVIGTYNGHMANVGRVVVDSSFHHFVNLNLLGFARSNNTTSRDKGQHAYNQIKTYFQNIGKWLAPKRRQKSIATSALWAARWTYPLNEEIASLMGRISSGKLRWQDALSLGRVTKSTLGDLVSPRYAMEYSLGLLEDFSRTKKIISLDDIFQLEPSVRTDSFLWLYVILSDFFLGGAVAELASRHDKNDMRTFKVTEEQLDEAIAAGTERAMSTFSEFFAQYTSGIKEATKLFTDDLG